AGGADRVWAFLQSPNREGPTVARRENGAYGPTTSEVFGATDDASDFRRMMSERWRSVWAAAKSAHWTPSSGPNSGCGAPRRRMSPVSAPARAVSGSAL